MKILHINSLDYGGAAKACLRLHAGLLGTGIDSKVLVMSKTHHDIPQVYEYQPDTLALPDHGLWKRLKRKARRILREFYFYRDRAREPEISQRRFLENRSPYLEKFSFPTSVFDVTNNKYFIEADVIHLHWIAGFLDYTSFFNKCKKPVIWTFHDMNPFTGGEHYQENFDGIDEEGFPLPRKRTNEEIEISEEYLSVKLNALKYFTNGYIVTPSNWLRNEALKSAVFKNLPVTVIPYGLDITVFKSFDREFAKEILGLPKDKFILLFVAESVFSKRKGFEYLQRALSYLDNKEVHLCAIGSLDKSFASNDTTTILGKIYDERLMALAYSAAEVFIIPSLMDNLPNTVLESLACGTPVVGFDIGGIPDMIEDGKNGFICHEISVRALTETIIKTINNYNLFDRFEISENAHKKYNPSIQAQEYISLYKRMV